MKHYNKKPIRCMRGSGKFGIASQSLKKFRTEDLKSSTKKVKKTAGNYMSLPKSSWANTQNSPPQGQWGQSNERNA